MNVGVLLKIATGAASRPPSSVPTSIARSSDLGWDSVGPRGWAAWSGVRSFVAPSPETDREQAEEGPHGGGFIRRDEGVDVRR